MLSPPVLRPGNPPPPGVQVPLQDSVATAGTFVYEVPGEAHTLVADGSVEPMRVHSNVTGPLIWLHETGEPNGTGPSALSIA